VRPVAIDPLFSSWLKRGLLDGKPKPKRASSAFRISSTLRGKRLGLIKSALRFREVAEITSYCRLLPGHHRVAIVAAPHFLRTVPFENGQPLESATAVCPEVDR
jgi:hypothetical protein